jgi:hypothetical protein
VINICVPVLNRYDMLQAMLQSLRVSSIKPDAVYVINNGLDREKAAAAIDVGVPGIVVLQPNRALGVAESWNWFINNVPEARIITNDDVEFSPQSLEVMAAADGEFVTAECGFSCFLIRDECVRKIGLFDETISPGYGYFEDIDYSHRMQLHEGVSRIDVAAGVAHKGSMTPRAYSEEDWRLHHQRFMLAENNYVAKWKYNPMWEQLKIRDGLKLLTEVPVD